MKDYKPFKMKKSSPTKALVAGGALLAFLTKLGIGAKAAYGIASTVGKIGATKIAGTTLGKLATSKAAKTIGKQVLSSALTPKNKTMSALKPKDQAKVQSTGIDNFASMEFGTGSKPPFAMKRNMKK
tara:strand:- start:20 stop:400 length:381 start_codon:yes stop_codon:yes gene_type:complete